MTDTVGASRIREGDVADGPDGRFDDLLVRASAARETAQRLRADSLELRAVGAGLRRQGVDARAARAATG